MSDDAASCSPESPSRHPYPARLRLRRQSEIRAVFDSGERAAGRLLALWVVKGAPESRVVVVAGRRVGGAVQRNRAKRLLREAYRLNADRLSGPCHLALVARAGCPAASRAAVEAELLVLLERTRCLGPAGPPAGREPGRRSQAGQKSGAAGSDGGGEERSQ